MRLDEVIHDLVHAPLASARPPAGLAIGHRSQPRVQSRESIRDALPDLRDRGPWH